MKEIKANKKNYGSTRTADKVKYIVVHYTGNKTDTAEANAQYFKNNEVKASAHYFVDNTEIVRSVPENYTAWSVGGKKYTDVSETGGASLYNTVTNTNSINIELCSTNGVITELTQIKAAELIRELMARYNIPITNVIRHFDVTGKHCPGWSGWYGRTSNKWDAFKAHVANTTPKTEPVKAPEPVKSKIYVVTAKTGLNVRAGAGTSFAKVGVLAVNTKIEVTDINGKWGFVPARKGWICMDYVKNVS